MLELPIEQKYFMTQTQKYKITLFLKGKFILKNKSYNKIIKKIIGNKLYKLEDRLKIEGDISKYTLNFVKL